MARQKLARFFQRVGAWLSRLFSRTKKHAVPVPIKKAALQTENDGRLQTAKEQDADSSSLTRSAQTLTGDGNTTVGYIGPNAILNVTYGSSPLPTGEPNPFGVPYARNPYFAGREVVLLQLHEQLTRSDAAAMTQVQAISGLGGIGKTQTAVEYAYRYHYKEPVYESVFWVNADTKVTLSSGYAAISEQVAVPNAQALSQEQKTAAVRTWLNTHRSWLLIFDNADQPNWLLPWMPTNPKGKVLITSRASIFDQLSIQTPIALDVLSKTEALTLLFERTDISRTEASETEAIALNQALDGLPLALEQASAYITRQKIGFGPYLRAYQNQGLTQLEKTKAQTGRYPSSVLKTWHLNMMAVDDENPAASAVLKLSAFLAPDEIPCRILTMGAEALGSGLADYLIGKESETRDEEAISLALRELLSLLSRYSLIRWAGTPDTYSLHRLVQAVVRDQIEPAAAADWLTQVTAALKKADPGSEFEQWPLCQQLLPHWLMVIKQALAIRQRSETLGWLANQAGFFLDSQGRYVEAEPLYLEALEISKAELGDRHPYTAMSLNNLAILYKSQGRYVEAEPLYLEALEIRKTELGDRHPYTAMSLNNLAALYDSQGRYVEAESLYLKALEIRKAELGDRHPYTASSLNGLAALYDSQGRYVEAEPLYLEALEIRKAELGDRHPYTASSLNNLAALYDSQGRYTEAKPLLIEALEIRKAELSDRHPDTASSLNNLAMLYKSQGRYTEAEPLLIEALEIWKAELGDRHPDTASSLNNLAMLYKSQGRYIEAEPLYLEALEISKAELGDRHPDTASSLNNLAALYDSQGRYVEAEPLYLEALEIWKAELGDRHPYTAMSLNNLAALYDSQGRYVEAKPLYLEALEIRKAKLGDRHPDTAMSLFNLATLYHQTRRPRQSLHYIQQALVIYIPILGRDHPTTQAANSWLKLIEQDLSEQNSQD